MTDRQANYHNMAIAALAEMDANNPFWSSNTKISAIVTAAKATVNSISLAEGIQSQPATGATKSEHSFWVTAAQKSEHICLGLKAYYTDISDMTNFDIVNFTISDFMHCTKLEATLRMQLVHDKAAAITIATLTPFNIVAADITGLQTAITNFANSLPQRTIMKANNKTATAQLPVLFTTLRGQLKQLDFLVGTMKVTQPTFVSNYTNARKIINLGKTQQAEELHLMPKHFEVIFGRKFSEGDTFTVRNHSAIMMEVFITDNTSVLPTVNGVKIPSKTDMKLVVSKDFGGVFGHWLMVNNPNALDDLHVTVILAHGKSHSSAEEMGNVTN